VAGVLLFAFQIGLTAQAAGSLLIRLTRLRLLTRSLRLAWLTRPLRLAWLTRPLRLAWLTLSLRLARLRLLTRLLLRLPRSFGLLTRPLLRLTRLVLLTACGPLHVQVLALFTKLAFLAAHTAAVQTFLVLGHGDALLGLERGRHAGSSQAATGRGPALPPLARASRRRLC
jgi:hypothetical protein